MSNIRYARPAWVISLFKKIERRKMWACPALLELSRYLKINFEEKKKKVALLGIIPLF